MFQVHKNVFRVAPQYQSLMRIAGLDAEGVFKDPRIKVWRTLPDRENATLDIDLDGTTGRLHLKRYFAARGFTLDAELEQRGHDALAFEKIPTAPLVGWGKMLDRRSFTIFLHLDGFAAADKLLERGEATFAQLLEPTADLAALLHGRGLHHRDLYLCHFFVKRHDDGTAEDTRLIDPARVRRLGGVFTRRRWIVKDLAQFWYSTTKLPVTDSQRDTWLARYASRRGLKPGDLPALKKSIERKVARIAAHDVRLNKTQPTRNVSIPS